MRVPATRVIRDGIILRGAFPDPEGGGDESDASKGSGLQVAGQRRRECSGSDGTDERRDGALGTGHEGRVEPGWRSFSGHVLGLLVRVAGPGGDVLRVLDIVREEGADSRAPGGIGEGGLAGRLRGAAMVPVMPCDFAFALLFLSGGGFLGLGMGDHRGERGEHDGENVKNLRIFMTAWVEGVRARGLRASGRPMLAGVCGNRAGTPGRVALRFHLWVAPKGGANWSDYATDAGLRND